MGWVAENGQVSAIHMWRSSGYSVYLSLPPISLSKSCRSAELGFNFGFGWFWALNWRRQWSPMRISIKRRFIKTIGTNGRQISRALCVQILDPNFRELLRITCRYLRLS